jgi:GxxExxY protein
MEIAEITGIIINASIKIRTAIGPGCFERIYEELLYYELSKKNFSIRRQILMPIRYEEFQLNDAYKLDLLVEEKIIVEIKSIEHILPVFFTSNDLLEIDEPKKRLAAKF